MSPLIVLVSLVQGAVLDEFMLAHLIGWIFKHMMIRDVGLSLVLSALFELMEYSFEFIQPKCVQRHHTTTHHHTQPRHHEPVARVLQLPPDALVCTAPP